MMPGRSGHGPHWPAEFRPDAAPVSVSDIAEESAIPHLLRTRGLGAGCVGKNARGVTIANDPKHLSSHTSRKTHGGRARIAAPGTYRSVGEGARVWGGECGCSFVNGFAAAVLS